MPAKLSAAGQDLPSGYKKGDIISVLPEGGDWGNKEVPPNFIRILVTNATNFEAHDYLKKWSKTYSYNLDSEDATSYTITLTVDPAVIDASQTNATLVSGISDYLVNHQDYTITVLNETTTSLQVNILKPADLQALADDVIDKFQTDVAMSLLYVNSADVDAAIAADPVFGLVTKNRGQMNSYLKSKLND